MEEFIDFLINNGLQLLYLVLTTLVSYLTLKIKNLYNKYVNEKDMIKIYRKILNRIGKN